MVDNIYQPYLKYATFCKNADEGNDGNLNLTSVLDLIELDEPIEEINSGALLTTLNVNLAFCIADASPGLHRLLVAIKTPGLPLDPPTPQKIEWRDDIIFQRWIKVLQIPIQKTGLHVAAILLDGMPLGEASFLVRFKELKEK